MTKKKNELIVPGNQSLLEQTKEAAWNSLSVESKKAYSSDYKSFFDLIQKDPKDVEPNDILKFIEHLESLGRANRTINRKIASISKMFKVMQIAGEIKQNPVDVLKQFKNISFKAYKNLNIGIDIKDIKKAIKVTKDTTENERKIILIIKTMGMSGVRISELTGMKNKDLVKFDDTNYIINLIGKGKKERSIFLSNELVEEIREMFPVKKEVPFIFYTIRGNRYDRKNLWKQMTDFFQKRIEKHVHPHMLRHFFITHKISVEGQDIKAVSRYAGHSEVATTLLYVDTALDVKNSKIKI